MIVIIEGMPSAEKTAVTHAIYKTLSDDNDATMSHATYDYVAAPEEIARGFFLEMLPALTYDKHVVMTSSWLSPEYSPLVTAAHKRMLERCALSRHAVVVNVGPADWLETYYAMPVVDLFPTTSIRDVIADVCGDAALKNPYCGGGMWSPGGVLMLCSKWGARHVKPGAVVVPYVNFSASSESYVSPSNRVAQALDEAGMPECDFYWVNVETPDGGELSPNIVDDLNPRAIVAIGHQPAAWCKRHGIDAALVSQPNRAESFNLAEILNNFKE